MPRPRLFGPSMLLPHPGRRPDQRSHQRATITDKSRRHRGSEQTSRLSAPWSATLTRNHGGPTAAMASLSRFPPLPPATYNINHQPLESFQKFRSQRRCTSKSRKKARLDSKSHRRRHYRGSPRLRRKRRPGGYAIPTSRNRVSRTIQHRHRQVSGTWNSTAAFSATTCLTLVPGVHQSERPRRMAPVGIAGEHPFVQPSTVGPVGQYKQLHGQSTGGDNMDNG